MDGSEAASGWARSSASRAPAASYPASSSSLGLVRTRRRMLVREEDGQQLRRILSSAEEGGGGGGADVSLREWLDRPGRAVDLHECLHIFRQIAEAVGSAHAQGIVVGTVRPSCFVMSPLNRVSFIESASCSTSGSPSSQDDAAGPGPGPPGGEGSTEGPSSSTSLEERRQADCAEEKKAFPLKRILLMESSWYTSPEEADGGCPGTFASDIYRLGVVLFELFCTFDSLEEKLATMADLRHRVLPPPLLLKWPKEASFCLWLLHPQSDTRPKMSEVLHSEFLNRPRNDLEERETMVKLTEEIEDQELLLEFLLPLQQRKQEVADRLHDSICFISADIQEVQGQRPILVQNSHSEMDKDGHSSIGNLDQPLQHPPVDVDSPCFGSRKRFRSEYKSLSGEELRNVSSEAPGSGTDLQIQQNIASKTSRLMKNFKKLEAAYFATRCRLLRSTHIPANKFFQVTSSGTGSAVRTDRSSVDDIALKEGVHNGGRKNEWINPFLEGLCKYLSFSKLKVKADLKQGDLLNTMNLVCSMGFDRDEEFFATAGVNKKIKVFECDMILNQDRDVHYPVVEMANRSKLSCICWNSYIKGQIASSDFEGVVQVWDVSRSQSLAEMREHERRVWSVDFSLADPTKLASGSDDGTVKLWSINKAGSIGTIRTKANVCSIQFQPDSAYSLAVGSADHKVYCFDLRNLRMPYCTLAGHTKTVSYVKYLDSSHLVSASTDNTLKLWNLPTSTSRALDNPLQTFTGHTNKKNFVGLSVSDGYIATGSETNEVFVYHKAFPMPVLSYKFSTADPISGQENDDASQFVSCICWRGQSSTLLAANSSGNIKFLEMV